jgi:hypothetical protein
MLSFLGPLGVTLPVLFLRPKFFYKHSVLKHLQYMKFIKCCRFLRLCRISISRNLSLGMWCLVFWYKFTNVSEELHTWGNELLIKFEESLLTFGPESFVLPFAVWKQTLKCSEL